MRPTSSCIIAHRVGISGSGPELCPDIPELHHSLVAGSAGAGRPCIAHQLWLVPALASPKELRFLRFVRG